jgi:quercetin dioxygenase-like cupin family protein
MSEGYTVMGWKDFEELEGSGGCTWHLARRSLGADSFGFNVVEIEPGGELPAHNESESGEEEVYVVLEGEGTFVADGSEHPAPAGTFVRYGPEVERTIRNESDSTVRALLIGVPEGSGYEPLSWA